MSSAFKRLFGAPKTKAGADATAAHPTPVEDYAEWCKAHPHDAEMLAAEFPRGRHVRCRVHDVNLVTAVGYRSRMDSQPSGDFMDAAAENPFCLDVGEGLKAFAASNPARLIFCEACEAGMKTRRR